ncbi:hypothetical protein LCGC14_2176160 [marine sediment metagenome]|uniref:Uncharacterized protein n=1 Tax=marine sediment metagenome TaxID=412755 RepID=A0A0F9G1B4_9ZZZZ
MKHTEKYEKLFWECKETINKIFRCMEQQRSEKENPVKREELKSLNARLTVALNGISYPSNAPRYPVLRACRKK